MYTLPNSSKQSWEFGTLGKGIASGDEGIPGRLGSKAEQRVCQQVRFTTRHISQRTSHRRYASAVIPIPP